MVNCLLGERLGCWTTEQLMHGLKAVAVEISRLRIAWESVAAAFLLMRIVAVGLADAYIDG